MRTCLLVLLAACDPALGRSTFTQTIPVGSGPIDVAAGDLDGDGRVDLVTVNDDGSVGVRLQRDGEWRTAPGDPPFVRAHMIALGHLDADGKLDVVTTDHDSGYLTVLRGLGDGGFAPLERVAAVTVAKPHNHGLVVADLDRDGDADVVVADQVAKQLVVVMSNGKRLEPRAPVVLPAQPYPPAVGDLDGDGMLDVVVPLVGDHGVAVLLGREGLATAKTFATTRARPYGLGVGDLDRDGDADVLVVHDDTETVVVMAGDGHGALVEQRAIDLPARVWMPVLVDVDRDGALDVIAAGSGRLVIAERGLTRIRSEAVSGWRVIAADFDGDHVFDLAAPDPDANVVRVWLTRR